MVEHKGSNRQNVNGRTCTHYNASPTGMETRISRSGHGDDGRKPWFSKSAPAVLLTIMVTMIAALVGAKMIAEKSSQHMFRAEINQRLFDVTRRQRSQYVAGSEQGMRSNLGIKPSIRPRYMRFMILRKGAVHDPPGGLLLG